MPFSQATQQRLDTIEANRADAARMLDAAEEPSIRLIIASAMRNLDEAAIWLKDTSMREGTRLLLADSGIASAATKLAFVSRADRE